MRVPPPLKTMILTIFIPILCSVILVDCRTDCEPLIYRQEIKAICRTHRQDVEDCYYSKFRAGSSAIYKCEDSYTPAEKNVSQAIRTLSCDERGLWHGYSRFLVYECRNPNDGYVPERFAESTERTVTPEPLTTRIPSKPTTRKLLEIQKEGLRAHNYYRNMYRVPLLVLNDELSKAAQSFAEDLIRANVFNNYLTLDQKKVYMQNIYQYKEMGYFRGHHFRNLTEVAGLGVKHWYESEYFRYSRRYPEPTAFTQMVWKATTDLGIGMSTSETPGKNRRTVLVATYSPPGNVMGEGGQYFRDNVPSLPLPDNVEDEDMDQTTQKSE